MAIINGLHRSIVNFDMRTESEPLEVKVPLLFSGMVGFPPYRDGRYLIRSSSPPVLFSCDTGSQAGQVAASSEASISEVPNAKADV